MHVLSSRLQVGTVQAMYEQSVSLTQGSPRSLALTERCCACLFFARAARPWVAAAAEAAMMSGTMGVDGAGMACMAVITVSPSFEVEAMALFHFLEASTVDNNAKITSSSSMTLRIFFFSSFFFL